MYPRIFVSQSEIQPSLNRPRYLKSTEYYSQKLITDLLYFSLMDRLKALRREMCYSNKQLFNNLSRTYHVWRIAAPSSMFFEWTLSPCSHWAVCPVVAEQFLHDLLACSVREIWVSTHWPSFPKNYPHIHKTKIDI